MHSGHFNETYCRQCQFSWKPILVIYRSPKCTFVRSSSGMHSTEINLDNDWAFTFSNRTSVRHTHVHLCEACRTQWRFIFNQSGTNAVGPRSLLSIFFITIPTGQRRSRNYIISTSKIRFSPSAHKSRVHFSHRWPPQSCRCFLFHSYLLKWRRETWLGCSMNASNKWMELVKFVYTKIKWPFSSGENSVIGIHVCRCWWELMYCCSPPKFVIDSADNRRPPATDISLMSSCNNYNRTALNLRLSIQQAVNLDRVHKQYAEWTARNCLINPKIEASGIPGNEKIDYIFAGCLMNMLEYWAWLV